MPAPSSRCRRGGGRRASPGALALAVLLSAAALPAVAQTPVPAPQEKPDQPVPQPEIDRERPVAGDAAAGSPATAPPAAPASPTAAAAAAEPEEPETAERPTFRLPIPEANGGGEVSGSADELEFVREDYAAASGHVEIHYQDVDLSADRIDLDLASSTATAVGHVVLDQGPKRLTAESAVFHLETKTGDFVEANAFVSPDYYFSGHKVSKIGDDLYTVEDGVFTSCSGEHPAWSFRLSRARVEAEGYAYVHNASMRVKRLPILYTPYIVWPAKSERTSGLLIPEIGYSARRGSELGLAYYQVLGRSFDTTLHVDTYSAGYLGVGDEFRYRPSEGTSGTFIGYAIRDPNADQEVGLEQWRWKLDWEHRTDDLPWGLRGVVSYHDFSDFQFFRDFERDFDRNTIRSLESRGFVSGNWGPHSLNVLVLDRETFLAPATATTAERTIRQVQAPEVEYRLRPTKLGALPVYLQALSSASWLVVDRQRNYNQSYGRFDLFPQLTLPWRPVPWMSLSVSGGGRLTWYSDSIWSDAELAQLDPERRDEILATTRFKGEALTRAVPFAGAEIVGPSVARIFDAHVGGFGRFKHVIEPRFNFQYLGAFDQQGEVPNFDEVDNLRRTVSGFGLGSTQSGRWSLVNRLLAKPAAEEGGSAREILAFEIGQEISFDSDQPEQRSAAGDTTQQGPLQALLRFSPSLETNLKVQVDYSTFFSNLLGTSLTGAYRFRRGSTTATWFTRYDGETGATRSDQVRLYGSLNVLPRRLRFDAQVNYDLEQSLLQQQSYVLNWTSQCYAVRLEMRDFRAGSRRDTEYYFTLSLKNVGTFLPLTARTTTTVP